MTLPEQYDAIVVGSGQAGGPLSMALAQAGRRTALIEREHVGGTCINEGCTPTKTMVASGRVAYLARRAAEYGVETAAVRIDLGRVRERKRAIVKSFREGNERRLKKTSGLDLVAGEARFVGPRTVAVDGRTLTASQLFVNVGCRPAAPDIAGIDQVGPLDSTSIMELDTVPEHLLVVGGGYIGLEFAQMFRRFGSRVTIVQRGGQLLPLEDDDIAEAVTAVLREDGIEVVLNARPRCAEPLPGGGVRLVVGTSSGEVALEGSRVLLAVGRVPNTDRLDPAAGGIDTDARGFIVVNQRLETSAPGVWALGDVHGGPAFTHISYDDFRVIRSNLLQGGDATTADRQVPYTVFIDPQLGRVGLSEREARAQGREYRVARLPMTHVARALEMDESRGVMKVLVEPHSGKLLGAAILGIEGGEIMAMLQLAMMGNLPYDSLRDAVFAHPTLAESLNNLFANLEGV
ncbi:MAG TPA: mercuric reductase [Gemmatimonadales bacterium]|nr:mercuric reductase [Gemmatimonadales bacterium]